MPYDGNQAGADALGAVRDAIQMYMGLRSDKFERQRRDEAESRAGRQLALQEEQHSLEMQQSDQAQQERDRKQIEFMVQQFGGQRAPQQAVQQGHRVGYDAAFEPEMTIPGRSLAQSVMAPPDISQEGAQAGAAGPQMPGQGMGSQATGEMLFRMPESEKSRIAAYNAQAKAYEGQANRDSREGVARMQDATRRAQIRSALNNTSTMAQAMKYGVDVRDATQRAALEQRIIDNTASWDNMQFDNLMSGGPLALISRFAGPQGIQMPTPPAPPTPNYYPGSQGGADQWTVKPTR